jgi:hypothetical protein
MEVCLKRESTFFASAKPEFKPVPPKNFLKRTSEVHMTLKQPATLPAPDNSLAFPPKHWGLPSGHCGQMTSQRDDTVAKEPGISVPPERGEDVFPPPQAAMSVVKSIELVLPKDAVHLAGSTIIGQVILTLNSTLVNPTVNVELMGRGYVEWSEEIDPSRDYSRDVTCSNKAVYVHQMKTFRVDGKGRRAADRDREGLKAPRAHRHQDRTQVSGSLQAVLPPGDT